MTFGGVDPDLEYTMLVVGTVGQTAGFMMKAMKKNGKVYSLSDVR